MKDLQIFNNPEFGEIRTVDVDGEPWFVGKDVAKALGYSDHLPSDLFAVQNDTDSRSDYFDTDKTTLSPGHPLYPYARAAAVKAKLKDADWAIKQETKHIARAGGRMSSSGANACAIRLEALAGKRETLEFELSNLPAGHPTGDDIAAAHSLGFAAETARIQTEKEQAQKERDTVLTMRNAGRAYIEEVAAAHPIINGRPVVVIEWSECPAFYSWKEGELKLSVAAADIILQHYDTAPGDGFCYYKTKFTIYYSEDGEEKAYTGRYDLGDLEGGLLAYLKRYNPALAGLLEGPAAPVKAKP